MIKYLKTTDEKCVGCMTCTSVCSKLYFKEDNPAKSAIQVNGLGGGKFHLVACDQECRKCVQECPTQAISVAKNGVVLVNKSLCVGCLACVAVCPIDAMSYFPASKHPFKCTACAACVPHCPSGALEIAEKEESPESKAWMEIISAVRDGEAV
ncbi:MAG TPA: 4Fe-4S binding protein [Rectinemataceae bacterium]|nr:4Fe-4S binding protein [Rectinemataceae bacterium]